MNNKTYFYRVAHKKYSWNGRYPMGPYAFFNESRFLLNIQKVPFSGCAYEKFVEFVILTHMMQDMGLKKLVVMNEIDKELRKPIRIYICITI